MPTTIAIALFPDVEELDWVGPWEVLRAWELFWPDDEVSVFTVADSDEIITCAKGMRVLPDRMWDTVGRFDVLLLPGGQGTRPQGRPPLHPVRPRAAGVAVQPSPASRHEPRLPGTTS